MRKYFHMFPLYISGGIAIMYGYYMKETMFNNFKFIVIAALLGFITGMIILSVRGYKKPKNYEVHMTKGDYKIYMLLVYMCSAVAIAAILNTHIPVGEPIVVNTVVFDLDIRKEKSGRRFGVIVNVEGYGKLNIRVDKKMWSQLSIGKPVLLTVQKGLLGFYIQKSISEYGS